MMKQKKKSIWKKSVDKHDFNAALDYLTLLYNITKAESYVHKLEDSKLTFRKAKDIVRASNLPLLTKKNKYVKQDLKKIKKGIKLSPVLLVVFDGKLIISDGYHRVIASYLTDEDLEIPCIIVY